MAIVEKRSSSGDAFAHGVRLAALRREKRLEARSRIHNRVLRPIEQPQAVRDPLVREDSAVLSTIGAARLFIAAVIVHVLVIALFLLVNRVVGEREEYLSERVQFRVVETLAPPEPEDKEEPKEVVVEEEPPIPSDFTPHKPEPAAPPPKREAKRKNPDPAPAAEPSDAPEPAEPVRRTVGLDFESTVSGGSGPSFATGTSRMGKTEQTATDPNVAKQRLSGSGSSSPTQRAAAHIPTRDVQFIKPKRVRPSKPAYPATLKAQEIEGTVKVSVDLDKGGNVVGVRVVQSSGHPAFDQAAIKAARAERFAPAKRDGAAVPYRLAYSYRFRIDDD